MNRTIYSVFLAILISCEVPEPVTDFDIDLDVSSCTPELQYEILDVVTWNWEKYPLNSLTNQYLDDLVEHLDADIIALQEIESLFAITKLLDKMPDWEGLIYPSGDLQLGYIYNINTIKIEPLTALFESDFEAFPRPAVKTEITFIPTGDEVTLFNIHLKCCGGAENEERRKKAAEKLKDYIVRNLPDEPVIVLGDYNESLPVGTISGSFQDIIEDSDQFSFADYEIASGDESVWSYPSWPSHIDHILISNELFTKVTTVGTVNFEPCFTKYPQIVSDHRPVYVSLEF